MAITAFSNLSMTVSDGGTVPSTELSGKKTYINIGSGNVLKVSWTTPTATNNKVDSYVVHVLMYDLSTASYKYLLKPNVGNVNEFYLKASSFASLSQSYFQLRIYVEAISAYGTAYNGVSATKSLDVSRGCGIYTKVEDGYSQPVMKRTVAFAQLDYPALVDSEGKSITDADENTIYLKATSVQDSATGWTVMQEFSSKDANNSWNKSDISYEILTDPNGDIVTDVNNSPIYTL